MSAPTLVDVLLAQLDDGALDALADRLAPRLRARLVSQRPSADEWLDAKRAEYVGLSPNALHKHTAARAIPFEQDGPGCRLWFRRAELDAWQRGERHQPTLRRVA